MRLHVRLGHLLVPLLLALLISCGGHGGGRQFSRDDAWTDPVPEGATMVSEAQFRQLLDSGQIDLITPAAIAAQAEARDRQFSEDVAFLRALPNPSQAVLDLLADLDDQQGFGDDVVLELDDDNVVVLLGTGHQVRQAVESEQLAADADNALAVYSLVFELLPESVRSGVPSPASLAGATVAQVHAALAQLDALLAERPNLGGASVEPVAVPPASSLTLDAQALRAGVGSDNDGPCAAPTGLAATHWFPLKNFLPPIKNQQSRGTCWAFASIGAVETRELVQNNNAVNLSEQFLVNQVKERWKPDAYDEGFSERALNLAVANKQLLMPESGWTYNPSRKRADPGGTTAAAYVGACDPYGTGVNAGSCSETAHQSPYFCATVNFVGMRGTLCGYERISYSGNGIPSSNIKPLWNNGEAFRLATYTNLLQNGHAIIASFPVYAGFDAATVAGGIVSDFSKTVTGAAGSKKKAGSHMVLLVGFISNAAMSTPGNPVSIPGGGYFVMKNSWGCGAGDGGYYYVPADYVEQIFTRLGVLEHDTRRSSAWQEEQRTPGTYDPPSITVTTPAVVGLRVETDLADYFGVSHPVAKGVTLNIISDKDGQIYSGGWNTDKMAFPPALRRTFASSGARTLTLTATHGRQSVSAKLVVSVRNTPPEVKLLGDGTAHVDEPFGISANIYDPNESSLAPLCANTTWSVDAPDTLSNTSGCLVQVTFGSTGPRTVRSSTRDSDGATTNAELIVNVQPPPPNPYPRITSFGVHQAYEIAERACINMEVANGATIDLTSRTSSLCRAPGATVNPRTYSAYITVENPDAEALTYDWRSYVTEEGVERELSSTLGSSLTRWSSGYPGNANRVTLPCRFTVRVNAPEAARSKSITVWTGRCTFDLMRLG